MAMDEVQKQMSKKVSRLTGVSSPGGWESYESLHLYGYQNPPPPLILGAKRLRVCYIPENLNRNCLFLLILQDCNWIFKKAF